MDLHKLAPVGGRATSLRERRRFERFSQMREDFPDRPRLGDEGNESDVAAAVRARQGKSSPTRAMSFAQAMREVSCERGF